jgi:hypothetical protein
MTNVVGSKLPCGILRHPRNVVALRVVAGVIQCRVVDVEALLVEVSLHLHDLTETLL